MTLAIAINHGTEVSLASDRYALDEDRYLLVTKLRNYGSFDQIALAAAGHAQVLNVFDRVLDESDKPLEIREPNDIVRYLVEPAREIRDDLEADILVVTAFGIFLADMHGCAFEPLDDVVTIGAGRDYARALCEMAVDIGIPPEDIHDDVFARVSQRHIGVSAVYDQAVIKKIVA